jgi:hypothetical protein
MSLKNGKLAFGLLSKHINKNMNNLIEVLKLK